MSMTIENVIPDNPVTKTETPVIENSSLNPSECIQKSEILGKGVAILQEETEVN